MALQKLKIRPDKGGYQARKGTQVVETELDGGAPRQRQDIIGAAARIPVRWTTGLTGHDYLYAFHELHGARGIEFLADLILESGVVVEHTCRFVAGSFGLVGHSGATYVLGAELWVTPLGQTDAALQAIVDAYQGG